MARADAKGYCDIAEGIEKVPSDGDAEVKDPAKLKLKQLNKTAYSELMVLMSCGKVAFMTLCKVEKQVSYNASSRHNHCFT